METNPNVQIKTKERISLGVTIKKIRSSLGWLVLTIYALLTLYPLIWLFISGFKTNEEFYSKPFSLPTELIFSNFSEAWKVANMGQAFLNSILVTGISLFLTMLLATITAFVLSKFQFKGKIIIIGVLLLGMLIPIHSTLVPLFILQKQLGLLNTYASLVLPYIAFNLPVAIFILVAFINTIPNDLIEAAFIDGISVWGLFGRIILPMSSPALSTVGILTFLACWNDYIFALVFINKTALKTLPISLSSFATGYSTNYGLTMAALTIAVIPTIIIYLFFQEKIMKGMTAGAVKG